jgi:hypothetical protein
MARDAMVWGRFQHDKQTNQTKQGVCHTLALPFALKSIQRQKTNYGNSNISLCKKYNLQKML